ncbi:MAG: hypothetical protein NVSMB9_37020 [Isosphaeraceae bacterium]
MRPAFSASLTIVIGLSATCLWAETEPSGSRSPGFREISEAVLAHHVEAPTRQQMIQAGIVGMYRGVGKPLPSGLAKRISSLTSPEQFNALLAEVRPRPARALKTEEEIDQAFVAGLSEGIPGGLELINAQDLKVAEQMAGNRYVGIQIAAEIDAKARLPKVRETLKGGPAELAGLKAGDLIDAVDGVDLGGGTLKQYIDQLRGPEGTKVTVRVRRPGVKEALSFRMTRAPLPHKTISGPGEGESLRLEGPDPIGYVKIHDMLASTPRELRELAARMELEELKALVIDLRKVGQGQGDLHSAVLLADELMDGGTIGRVRMADRVVIHSAEPGALFRDWPMVVLVDEKTQGHAEWLAAALQDSQRASIVGRRTAGLGETLSSVPVGKTGWGASLATGLLERWDGRPLGYFPERGRPIFADLDAQGEKLPKKFVLGVTPDVVVPKAGKADNILAAGVELLRKALSRPDASRVGEGSTPSTSPTTGRPL